MFRGERYLPVGYYLTKPFKASDDVRMMDQGGIGAAAVIMALLVLSRIVSMGMTGFLFNNQRLENIQAGQEILLVFALYGGFICATGRYPLWWAARDAAGTWPSSPGIPLFPWWWEIWCARCCPTD